MTKKKIFKVLFFISFLPYIILILISIYHAILGYDIYTWINHQYVETINGIDAFTETLFWNGITFSIIPILPISLIYQIIYIVIYFKNKRCIEEL